MIKMKDSDFKKIKKISDIRISEILKNTEDLESFKIEGLTHFFLIDIMDQLRKINKKLEGKK